MMSRGTNILAGIVVIAIVIDNYVLVCFTMIRIQDICGQNVTFREAGLAGVGLSHSAFNSLNMLIPSRTRQAK
jgi:hypothetical protein